MPEDELNEESTELQPFMMEDLEEVNLCQNCEHIDNCAILHKVNLMSMRRDGKKLDDDFGCTPFYKEITLEEEATV